MDRSREGLYKQRVRALLLILSLVGSGLGAAWSFPAAPVLADRGVAHVDRDREPLALAPSVSGNDWLRTIKARRQATPPVHFALRPPALIDALPGLTAIRLASRTRPLDLSRLRLRLNGPHEPRAPPAVLG